MKTSQPEDASAGTLTNTPKSHIVWNEGLSTGIRVIDGQHKRIIRYINQLSDAQALGEDAKVHDVLVDLVDYTLSHFAFEESMMEEAYYAGLATHKKTHEAFANKIREYSKRFDAGDNVTEGLRQLLNVWLMDHIADDDHSYVPYVLQNLPGINTDEKETWIRERVKRFFN